LAAQRQTTTMANSTVRTEIHQTLDIHRRLTTQITFYCEGSNRGSQLRNFRFRQIFDRRIRSDACRFANLLRARVSNSLCLLYVPLNKSSSFTPALALALLMPCVGADHPHNTVAANDFAVSADFFN
jgi:hypothetical protein